MQATPMPIPKDIGFAAKVPASGVEKVRRPRKRSSARKELLSPAGALMSHHYWPSLAKEAASGSSDQNREIGKGQSQGRTSSNEDYCLACPYAKLNSIAATQSIRDSGGIGRSRCRSVSYPNISRLKYAEIPPKRSYVSCS